MSNKKFVQQFSSEFTGINAECSSLEPEGREVNKATNLELAAGNSLRGRPGCQLAANPGNFLGLYTHTYTRTTVQYRTNWQSAAPEKTSTLYSADGTTVSETIAVNDNIWTLDNFIVPITRVSGTYPITWYTTVSGGTIHFIMKANGTTFLDYDCGTGLEDQYVAGYKTVYSLLQAIDSTAELSITINRDTCPPFAISSATQTAAGAGHAKGTIYTFNVNAGHTFYPGDWATWYSDNLLVGGIVTATTGTTLTILGPTSPKMLANQVIGYLGATPAAFPIAEAQTTSSSPFYITFPYWRIIPWCGEFDAGRLLQFVQSKNIETNFKPLSFISAQGDCFLTGPDRPDTTIHASHLWKYDAQAYYRAGMFEGSLTLGAAGAGSIATGSYKYKVYFRRVDNQGNIVEGAPGTPVSLTVAAGPVGQNIVIPQLAYTNYPYADFMPNTGYANGGGAPQVITGGPLIVDDGAGGRALFDVGDYIYFLDSTFNPHRVWITGVDNQTGSTKIYISDTSAITVADNAEISAGVTAVILRTANGGNTYYEVKEVPVSGYGTYTFLDALADATLIANTQYLEVPIGKEHNPPDRCSLVCQHQGGLVIAGDPLHPNTVGFSSSDGIEYFPVASNYFDVPSTVVGPVTAVASDVADRLAVFKSRAYYDVIGDLDAGAFVVNAVCEGDYGIASQASLARVDGALIGLSEIGFVAVREGHLDDQIFRKLNARLIGQDYKFQWAVAVNDFASRAYHCSILSSTAAEAQCLVYSIDYSREVFKFLDKEYSAATQPDLGMTMNGTTLYHLNQWGASSLVPKGAVYRRLARFDGNSPTGNDGDTYIDHIYAINYVLESQPVNFGEPGLLKTPLRLRLWSLTNDYIINGWVPFSVLVETGASALAQYIGSAYSGGTSSTFTFAAETDIFKDTRLVSPKTHFYIVRFTTNTLRESPYITGYEVMYALAYEKEDFVK